jgi:hypothetical protein
MAGLRSSIIAKSTVSPKIVKLTERFDFPDGKSTVEDVYAANTGGGWRHVNAPK